MKSLGLIGKRYVDTIISVNGIENNETNSVDLIAEKKGGIYNFYDIPNFNLSINVLEFGIKRAFIISDLSTSTRTSFVSTQKQSDIVITDVLEINRNFEF